MNIIKKLYKKLKILFSKKNNEQISTNKPKIIGSLIFNLYVDSSIDVICYAPETEGMTSDELTKYAENFGNFIGAITDGKVSDTILKLLENTKKDTNDPIDQLFIDNILFFWAMSHASNKSSKDKKISSKPVVRPTAVFSQTKSSID